MSPKLVFTEACAPEYDDGGLSLTIEATGEDALSFVRLMSWDEEKQHATLRPFIGQSLRVTVEIDHPYISAPAHLLDDEQLSLSRAQTCARIGSCHVEVASRQDPRQSSPAPLLDLAQADLLDAQGRLSEIDAEITRRLQKDRQE